MVNVRNNLVIGALLATFVLFLFLRTPSATVIGALGIPVCTLAAFLGLLISGRTINVISLAGVAFAIGMTLDNSIVVLENIYRHMAAGKDRRRAALDGVAEVWPALLASTLTTVFVFIPIIFIKQEAGQLYSDIAVAISASILMSLLVATLVVPTLCSRFLSLKSADLSGAAGLYVAGQRVGELLVRFVHWLMDGITRRVGLIILVGCITALIFASIPKAEYLPEGEEQKIFVPHVCTARLQHRRDARHS